MTETDARHKIAAWMTDVMASRDWSALDWATRADPSATNLTRFLAKVETGHVPTAKTIEKLSRAAGSAPQLFEWSVDTNRSVPILSPDNALQHVQALRQTRGKNVTAASKKKVSVPGDVPDRAFAITLSGNTMSGAGILDSDVAIIDPALKPSEGSVVVVLGKGAQAYRMTGKMLMPQSVEVVQGLQMKDVKDSVIGVAIKLIRDLN